MQGWTLQLVRATFVKWGYGPPPSVTHIYKAMSIIKVKENLTFRLPFTLPEPSPHLPPPQVYERVRCWGWRFLHMDTLHECGWNLAKGRRAALQDALQWARDNTKPYNPPDLINAAIQAGAKP